MKTGIPTIRTSTPFRSRPIIEIEDDDIRTAIQHSTWKLMVKHGVFDFHDLVQAMNRNKPPEWVEGAMLKQRVRRPRE